MNFTKNMSKLLEQVYPESIIDKIDVADIRRILTSFSLENCKVVLQLKNLFEDDGKDHPVGLPEKIDEVKRTNLFCFSFKA